MQACWESGLKDTLSALTGFGSRLNPEKRQAEFKIFFFFSLLTTLVVL